MNPHPEHPRLLRQIETRRTAPSSFLRFMSEPNVGTRICERCGTAMADVAVPGDYVLGWHFFCTACAHPAKVAPDAPPSFFRWACGVAWAVAPWLIVATLAALVVCFLLLVRQLAP